MASPVDITGERFGMLTAIKDTGEKNSSGCHLWECRCDCGGSVITTVGNLRFGTKWNCGCTRRERKRVQRREKIECRGTFPPDESCVSYRGDHCECLTEMFCATRGKCVFYTPKEISNA